MPLSDYLTASGHRVHGGEQGLVYTNVGRIWFSKAPKVGIDSNLLAVLKIAVDQLHLTININSVDTGTHSPSSRHYSGRAADINKVGPILGQREQATLTNPHALRLARFLLANGFRIGEGGPWAAVLFGPVHTALNPTGISHDTHLHASLPWAPGSGQEDAPSGEPEANQETVRRSEVQCENTGSFPAHG